MSLRTICLSLLACALFSPAMSFAQDNQPGQGRGNRGNFDPAQIIGRRPEELGLERFPYPVRVILPGMAVTMDYSPARLNLEVDERGHIFRFHCG